MLEITKIKSHERLLKKDTNERGCVCESFWEISFPSILYTIIEINNKETKNLLLLVGDSGFLLL